MKVEKKLSGKHFQGSADAEQTATLLLESVGGHWHAVGPTIEEKEVPVKRRGRPKVGVPMQMRMEYTVTLQITDPKPEAIQAERKRRSTFILLTSDMTLDAKTGL